MEERSPTQWARSWEVVPASMSPRGLAGTGLIGSSTLPNRAIDVGVTHLFWICTGAALRPGLDARIHTTAGRTEQCTCSLRQPLTRFPWPYLKELKSWACNDSRIRMAK